jgi:uncharacterized protein (DUF2141 family)
MKAMVRTRYGLCLLALFAFSLFLAPFARLNGQTAGSSTLTVRVTGARNSKGKIRIALFQNADGFPGDGTKAFRAQQAEIDPQSYSAQVVFEGIPQTVYAVSVFHDENMNGKLDKNLMGMPKEGYGASNNPKKRMGPPRFEDAKFAMDQAQTIEIRLMY